MSLRPFIRKHVKNNIVVVLMASPNLAITTGTVTLLSYFWHWSFVFAPTVYYLVGQVFSVQYSAFFGRAAKMTIRLGGRAYNFNERGHAAPEGVVPVQAQAAPTPPQPAKDPSWLEEIDSH